MPNSRSGKPERCRYIKFSHLFCLSFQWPEMKARNVEKIGEVGQWIKVGDLLPNW